MKPVVRVLIVTDDGGPNGGFLPWREQPLAAAVGPNSREFHLGEFMHVLQDTVWLGFDLEITKAHRSSPGTDGLDEAALKADRGADVVGFRFDKPFIVNGENRILADYDMALFFAIYPRDPDTALGAEAEAIARFMENGSGFFATGDHANLGSELCGLIPRVRSMRRWWEQTGPNGEPAAPPPLGLTRHDTTQPGADSIGQFEDQSDDVAQEITPTLYAAGLTVKQGYPASRYLPHPLLCSPDGVVAFLPDHMHEGWCEVPGNLGGRQFTLGGATVREYPDYTPANAPAGYVPAPLAPELVATGQVRKGITSPASDPRHVGASDPVPHDITFGVIGAWDGHRVGKGRVVVDSTWHHFFDINLTGDRYLEDNNLTGSEQQKLHGFYVSDGLGGWVPNAQFKMIMWYYRNIIYWLIPAGRHSTIWWQVLSDLNKRPQFLEELGMMKSRNFKDFRLEHYLYFGQLAEEYLAKARGRCAVYTIHPILFNPKIPWWEWIQVFVDVWNPIQKVRVTDEIMREQLLGALGVAARPDVAVTLSLGAAVVTAASARYELAVGADSSAGIEVIQKLWPAVLNHALGEFKKQLAIGAEMQRKLEKVIAAQTTND